MENILETIKFFLKIISKKVPSIFLLVSIIFLGILFYSHLQIKEILIKGNFDLSFPKFRLLSRYRSNEHPNTNYSSLDNYLYYFQFIQNLTENDYVGKWTSAQRLLMFDNNHGNIEMKIFRANYEELFMEKDEGSFLKNCLRLDIILTDDNYSDRFVNFNVTLNITDLFTNPSSSQNDFLISKINVLTNISFWEIIEKTETKGILLFIKKVMSLCF